MNNHDPGAGGAPTQHTAAVSGRLELIQRSLMAICGAPDSAIAMEISSPLRDAMESRLNRQPESGTATIYMDGVHVSYTLDEIAMMGTQLATARAERRFPRTTAGTYDIRATVEDFARLAELNEARGTAPPEEWNRMPEVVQLHVRIAQEIRARDKTTAELTEEQRVKTLVNNLMEGVDTESRIYGIVQHAVTRAINNDKGDEAARLAGQNMIQMLSGIRAAINEMASQRTHTIDNVNMEGVLEDIFGIIDHALSQNVSEFGGRVEQMDGQINRVDGQINRVDGQIMHLNAIGQHVNAIDGHVHSLGNNLNAMGVLLNSTNGNITGMTTQVSMLQTIVNMLPQMIQQVLHERLSQALEEALRPIIALLEEEFGMSLAGHINPASTQGRSVKKSIKSFFKGLFKGPHKPDY